MFNQNRTNREFQSGLKHEERRRSRQDDRLKLRRADRENRLQKKRQTLQHRRRNFNGNNQTQNGSSQDMQNGQMSQNDPVRSENKRRMLQQLPQFVQGCYSDHPAAQFECTQRIRKLLSIERDPPIQEVINSGVVTRLIQFLDFDNYQQLQFEAAWALTNIASGKAEETAVVVRYGAVPKFVKLMGSSNEELKEQVIWALGNIAGDSPELRNLVLSHNAMDALLQVCDTNNMTTQKLVTLQRNLTWTLSNFCRGKPQPEWQYTKNAIRALNIMLMADDDEILQDACWAFSYLSDIAVDDSNDQQANQQISAIYTSGALARLVQLLQSENPHIRHPALRSIGNIATGTEEHTQWVINLGVLKKLQSPLLNDRLPIKREACWTISNITAGSPTQIEAVISANLIPPLINVLKHSRFEVAKEALWCLSNATSGGNDAQIKFLVNQGIIGPLCQFLKGCQHIKGRNKLKMVTLEALDNILKVGRGVNGPNGRNQFAIYCEEADCDQILEELQADNDNHEQIFDIAGRLMKEYFDGEEGYIDGPSTNDNNGFNQNQNNNNYNNNNMNNNNGWNVNNNQNNNNANNNNPFGGNNNNNNNNSNGQQFGFGIGGNGFNSGWNGNNGNNNNNNANNSAQNFNF